MIPEQPREFKKLHEGAYIIASGHYCEFNHIYVLTKYKLCPKKRLETRVLINDDNALGVMEVKGFKFPSNDYDYYYLFLLL